MGSRLHKGSDGTWYAYAQWRAKGDRERAFDMFSDHLERGRLNEAIDEYMGETELEIRSDFLAAPPDGW